MPKKKSLEQFIAEARVVHGDKYDYSKVVYTNSQTKVCIICPIHGEFWQRPGNHVLGQGCPACGGTKKRTREEFIQQARALHGDKYNYDKVVYVNDATKVTLVCPKHGDFLITPDSHIHSKQGCKKCAHERIGELSRLSQEEFIKKATVINSGKYLYDKATLRWLSRAPFMATLNNWLTNTLTVTDVQSVEGRPPTRKKEFLWKSFSRGPKCAIAFNMIIPTSS